MTFMNRTKAQITGVPHVVDERCLACRVCQARKVCKSKAILQIDRDEPPFVDPNLCYGCLACIPACPAGAIVLDGKS
jgi:MinD superfamily P-loop ATPase